MDGANLMAMTESNRLTLAERKRWNEIKAAISSKLPALIELGMLLHEARDSKLYREEHGTYEAFVESLGLARKRAYAIEDAAVTHLEVVSEISDNSKVPVKESHLLELSKAPEGEAAKVWEAVVKECDEKGIEPTAKIVARVRKEHCEQQTIPESEAEQEREPGEDPVPEDEIAKWGCAILECRKGISAAINKIMAMPVNDYTAPLSNARNHIRYQCELAIAEIGKVTPHAVCPRCKGGAIDDGCGTCGNHGWVNSAGTHPGDSYARVENEFRLRDYQIDAVVNAYLMLGVEPAGPADDDVVAEYRRRVEPKADTTIDCPF